MRPWPSRRPRRPRDRPAKYPVQLGKPRRDVCYVLEHLHAKGAVKALVLDGQRSRTSLVQLDVVISLTTSAGQGKHLTTGVKTDDLAAGRDLLGQLGAIETRPAAHIENPLARRGGQRGAHQATVTHRVFDPVQRLELLPGLLIELKLAHAPSLPERRARRGGFGSAWMGAGATLAAPTSSR